VIKLLGVFSNKVGSYVHSIYRNQQFHLIAVLLALVPLPGSAATAQAPPPAKAPAAATPAQSQSGAEWQVAKNAGDAAVLRGDSSEAEEKYGIALAATEKLKDNKAVLSCLTALANCLAAQTNKMSDEEPLRQQAVALAEKTYGANSPQFATKLAELADLQARKGDTGLAEESTDKAVKILDGSEDKFPMEMATCYQAIGERQIATHSLGLADDSFKKALDLRSAKLPANDLLVLDTCRCYADLLTQLDRKDEAKKFQERIVLARAQAPGAAKQTPADAAKTDDSKPILAKLIGEAKAASKGDDQAKAVTCWKAVVETAEKSGVKDGRLPYALVHLGDAYRLQGSTEEAAALYKRAFDLSEQAGSKSLGVVRSVNRLADIELQKKNNVEGSRLLIKALALEDDRSAPDTIIAATLNKMVSACMAVHDNANVELAAKRLIPLAEKIGGPTANMQKSMAAAMLGMVYMKSGRMSDGIQLMKSMGHVQKQSPEDITKAAKDAFAADNAVYDKSEEASFLD
jgi:tetratricopeptide (TPR) repeat protein